MVPGDDVANGNLVARSIHGRGSLALATEGGTFAMDLGLPEDDSPTWTDVLQAIAVRKRREEMSHVTASRAR